MIITYNSEEIFPYGAECGHKGREITRLNFFLTLSHFIIVEQKKNLLKKLIFVQLFKRFSAFYGTRGFSIVFITAIHYSLS
jgi:hypothetical protein